MKSCRGVVKDCIDEDFYIRELENCRLRFVKMLERRENDDDLKGLEWGLSARVAILRRIYVIVNLTPNVEEHRFRELTPIELITSALKKTKLSREGSISTAGFSCDRHGS